MSIHIPWAEEAQLTEDRTDTYFVGSLRECVRLYAALPDDAQANALILADAPVPVPGRSTKVLEHGEIQTLIAAFDADQIASPDIADLITMRVSAWRRTFATFGIDQLGEAGAHRIGVR